MKFDRLCLLKWCDEEVKISRYDSHMITQLTHWLFLLLLFVILNKTISKEVQNCMMFPGGLEWRINSFYFLKLSKLSYPYWICGYLVSLITQTNGHYRTIDLIKDEAKRKKLISVTRPLILDLVPFSKEKKYIPYTISVLFIISEWSFINQINIIHKVALIWYLPTKNNLIQKSSPNFNIQNKEDLWLKKIAYVNLVMDANSLTNRSNL